MRSEDCRWLDDKNKCWYWMPDSKMTCNHLENQENCKEYGVLQDKEKE